MTKESAMDIYAYASDMLVAIDRANLLSLQDPATLYRLEIAANPHGKTQLAFDFQEPWKEVYNRETVHLVELLNKGVLFAILLDRGDYKFEITDKKPNGNKVFEANFTASSGQIIVGDVLETMFNEDFEETCPYMTTTLEPGNYKISVYKTVDDSINISIYFEKTGDGKNHFSSIIDSAFDKLEIG